MFGYAKIRTVWNSSMNGRSARIIYSVSTAVISIRIYMIIV
jgi:hypothetical protein